jgi:thiol:disulfide interchange protein
LLNDSSYLMAICIYAGSALTLIAYVGWWLGRHWRASWVALVMLLMAALLLTPAYPKAGVNTMAPALIVVAFQIMTTGVQGAAHALRPLVFMSGSALILALLLGMTVLRRRRAKPARKARPTAQPDPRAKPPRGARAVSR